MKRLQTLIFILFAVMFGFTSCSRALGYSVLLWDIPEKNLQDGTIVRVLLKSNISRVYIVQADGSREKVEVPFWQISAPQSKRKTLNLANKYSDRCHQYARIKVDGLPVRKEPVNTAKQVYRLHQDEVVKVLYKGDGQDVMVGRNKKLEGEWLCVLTHGGTTGWCFSYNLTLFTTGQQGAVVSGEVRQEESTNEETMMEQILNAKWYPESYLKQLDENMIDLETMRIAYGFDTGVTSGKVTVNVFEKYLTAKYNGAVKIKKGVYSLVDTPFQIVVKNPDAITVTCTQADVQEAFNFVTLPEDIDLKEIIEAEKERRQAVLDSLYKIASFQNENYGTLVFNSESTFSWHDYNLLAGNVIPEEAGENGTVRIKYLIDKSLQTRYDGCLTFVFEGKKREVNFLYKFKDGNLSLETVNWSSIKNTTVLSRSSSPTVINFTK